ncbi:MAG TPA: hypothetical protein VF772_06560, partial [Terriglobales bacterium]
ADRGDVRLNSLVRRLKQQIPAAVTFNLQLVLRDFVGLVRRAAKTVRSKLKCPLFIAIEMSGF